MIFQSLVRCLPVDNRVVHWLIVAAVWGNGSLHCTKQLCDLWMHSHITLEMKRYNMARKQEVRVHNRDAARTQTCSLVELRFHFSLIWNATFVTSCGFSDKTQTQSPSGEERTLNNTDNENIQCFPQSHILLDNKWIRAYVCSAFIKAHTEPGESWSTTVQEPAAPLMNSPSWPQYAWWAQRSGTWSRFWLNWPYRGDGWLPSPAGRAGVCLITGLEATPTCPASL